MAATHKILFILAYALLEWTLILLLLLNSLFSFLIRKFATYYALKPPCFWCSTIDHLLEPNNDINRFHNLICEAHATEFVNLYHCPDRQKVTTEFWYISRNGKCSCCSMNVKENSVDKSPHGASKMKSSYEENEMVGVMDLPMENKSRHLQVFDQIIPLEWTDSSASCSTSSSINGDENMVIKDEEQVQRHEGIFLKSDEEDKAATVERLMAELKFERLAVCGLYKELDEERNASAVAANQAMVMITRLQEEKVALQTEYMQSQRMMDEQANYDQDVVQLLNELVMKLEHDKFELENELEMYREKFFDYDGKKKAKVLMPRFPGASCSKTVESLNETNVSDIQNLEKLEESIEEFEVERLWILDKLQELDETLMMLTNDQDEDPDEEASLEGEKHLRYKGNILFRAFDTEGMDEDDEASHSVWPILENIKSNGDMIKGVEV